MTKSKNRKLADLISTGSAFADGSVAASEVTGLGTAATQEASAFATAAQGTLAASALQPTGDGSGLTGVSSSLATLTDSTVSTVNPTLSTNPTSGVGHVWLNKTTGSQYILIDASSGANVWANADHNRPGVAPMVASGGTEVTSGGYKYHTFTSSGTFTVGSGFVGGISSLEVLAIGGGGGGSKGLAGDYPGGGSGAGQVISQSFSPIVAGDYTVIIGAGGALRNENTERDPGHPGEQSQVKLVSTFFVRAGPGGGGGKGDNDAVARNGQSQLGSGGGGGNGNGTGGIPTGSPSDRFTEIRSNAGGDAVPGGNRGSGGGGGAGAAGQDGTTSKSGDGGSGTNEYSVWATATSTGVSGYYAGGSGGAPYNNANQAGLGGAGGGGAGALSASPGNGAANTGSAGGGYQGPRYNGIDGSAGGSGIVIIRYAV
jgi:hypothetical protein